MKVAIALSEDLLHELDGLGGPSERPRLIERAIREFLDRYRAARREARDREILDRHAEEMAEEMGDVLAYQVEF